MRYLEMSFRFILYMALGFALGSVAVLAYAQPSYDSALAACRAHSLTVPTDHPGKLTQAQEADFQKCIDANLPDPQRRTLALYNEKSAQCNTAADDAMKLDKLVTAAERKVIYTECMGPRYLVQ